MQESRRMLLKSVVAGGLAAGALGKATAMPTDRPKKWDASHDVVIVSHADSRFERRKLAAERGCVNTSFLRYGTDGAFAADINEKSPKTQIVG